VPAFDPDIARQTTEPPHPESTPECHTEQGDDDPENNQHFPNLRHAMVICRLSGQAATSLAAACEERHPD